VPAGFVSLELRDKPVDEVLQTLAAAAGQPIAIDADAQAVAHCARVTLFTGGNMPTSAALDLLGQTLAPAGFTLGPSSGPGLVLRRAADKPLPATCQRATGGTTDPRPSGLGGELGDRFAAGVRRISDTEYDLARSSVELLLENQAELMRSARLVPRVSEGKTKGVRLFGIRASSPLAVLGLQNGDTLLAIQGHGLANPDEALAAYADMKKAKSIELKLERKDAILTITYHILEK